VINFLSSDQTNRMSTANLKDYISRSSRRKTVLFLLFCVYVLVLLEGSARIFVSIPTLWQQVSKGQMCDAVWRISWVKRHKNRQVDVFYSFDIYHPTRGWGLKPNIKDQTTAFGKTLNSNCKGIRGKLEYKYGKNWEKTRILVLGDSFTFGDEVSDDETYPHFLQQMLPGTEVINFGVHGYGHDQMLIYLKEEGVKYEPHIVILGVILDDTHRNVLSFRDYAKPKFELVSDRLKLRNSPVPSPEETLEQEFWRSKFFDLLSVLYHNFRLKSGRYEKGRKEISGAILNELLATIKSINAVPVFVYLSGIRDKKPSEGMTLVEERFFAHWKKKGVHCVFLRPYVSSARKKGVILKEKGHFGPKTNQIIARGTKEYLTQNKIIRNKHEIVISDQKNAP